MSIFKFAMYFVPPQKPRQKPPAPNLSNAFSPEGMLRPRDQQAPPMFGPRGATIPPKFLNEYSKQTPQANLYQNKAPYQHQHQHHHQQQQQFRPQRGHNWRPGAPQNRQQQNWQPRGPNANNFQKSPLPANGEFVCEPCDREFHNMEMLEKHKSEHSVCGLDGCTFSGHEKILRDHIKMQHQTKLFDKLKNLNTPEEIELWRAERKKRFPTKENIELRQKAQEERAKRGEKLNESKNRFASWVDRKLMEDSRKDGAASAAELKNVDESNVHRNGHKKDNKRNRNRKRGNKTGKGNNDNYSGNKIEVVEHKMKETSEVVCEAPVIDEQTFCGLKMFQGTSAMEKYKNGSKKIVQSNNALGLLGVYGDDDITDSDAIEDETEVQSVVDEIVEQIIPLNPCPGNVSQEAISVEDGNRTADESACLDIEEQVKETHMDGAESENEAPSECPVDKPPALDNIPVTLKRPSNPKHTQKQPPNKRIKSGLNYHRLKKTPQNTMLEKLLQPDIRHERNMLLQCVRHIVKSNFFGMGQKLDQPKTTSQ